MFKFCSECGAKATAGTSKFCLECGHRFDAASAPPTSSFSQAQPAIGASFRAPRVLRVVVPPVATGAEAQEIYDKCIDTIRKAKGGNNEIGVKSFKENCRAYGLGGMSAATFHLSLVGELGLRAMATFLPQLVRLIPDEAKRRELLEYDQAQQSSSDDPKATLFGRRSSFPNSNRDNWQSNPDTARFSANSKVHQKMPKVTDVVVDKESLIQDIVMGSASVVLEHMKNGADPNTRNEMGDTLLHLAVEANQGNMVDLLLRTPGISIDERNKDNMTPLLLAIKLGYRGIATLIYNSFRKIIIEIPSSDIVIDYESCLGSGAYGAVYKGTYHDVIVAIKTAHIDKEDQLIKEISTMIQCRSPYIIDIVAVSGLSTRKPILALEFMDCGDLRKYLNAKRDGKRTLIEVSTFEVAWVVANALADLHHNGIVHRDLKSQNVLLSTTRYIKLGDLGISRAFEQSMMTTKAGTPFWEAPEVLKSGVNYDYAADIYSFGVILTELDTLQTPYAELKNKKNIIDSIENGKLRPSVSAKCEPWLRELTTMCLAFNPKDRPSAQRVIDYLRRVKLGYQPKVNPPLVTRQSSVESSSRSATTASSSQSTNEMKSTCKWTQFKCMDCNSLHHITAEVCASCSAPLSSPSEKLTLLLKRVDAVKKKDINITSTISCNVCFEENELKAVQCQECANPLPFTNDSQRLKALAKRFEKIAL